MIRALVLPLLAALLWLSPAAPVRADLHHPDPSQLLPLRDLISGLWRGEGPPVFNQRAIEEPKKKPTEEPEGTKDTAEPQEAAEPEPETQAPAPAGAEPPASTTTPPPAPIGESVLAPGAAEVERKSPTKAFLLSAMLPGLGELYSGSNRGYLFLGVEAVSWITFASYQSSAGSKEDEMFTYADGHFAIGAFEEGCVGQPGQSCQDALDQIEHFYANDPDEYYEIISKNPIYRAGWGVSVTPGGWTYENGPPPECTGSDDYPCLEQYRRWAADQSAAQDRSYVDYNELRDDRNSLDRTARGMTMVVLANHVVSAWDALMVARGFNARIPGQVEMNFKIKGSFTNPGAKFVLRRKFY